MVYLAVKLHIFKGGEGRLSLKCIQIFCLSSYIVQLVGTYIVLLLLVLFCVSGHQFLIYSTAK